MIYLTSRCLKLHNVAMFTQQQNGLSVVYQSCSSHTVQLFTAAFCNQTLGV